MLLLLIIILIILALGGLPMAPWGGWHSYGWAPSGIGLVLVIVLVVILLSGRL